MSMAAERLYARLTNQESTFFCAWPKCIKLSLHNNELLLQSSELLLQSNETNSNMSAMKAEDTRENK
jgi:hypothetical protein